MYSLVLMMALSNGTAAPGLNDLKSPPEAIPFANHAHQLNRGRRFGCHGCFGGCHGCFGGCHGCFGGGMAYAPGGMGYASGGYATYYGGTPIYGGTPSYGYEAPYSGGMPYAAPMQGATGYYGGEGMIYDQDRRYEGRPRGGAYRSTEEDRQGIDMDRESPRDRGRGTGGADRGTPDTRTPTRQEGRGTAPATILV